MPPLKPWIALLVVLAVFIALQWRRGVPTDLLFLGGLLVVTLCGVVKPEDALAGFANPAVITIGALFVVAAGLRSTGVLDWVGNQLLGTARTAASAMKRLTFTVLGVSAFINNTPVVAMFVPVVVDWCRKRGISPSRLLIPLSYLAIMGGTCTLIGTSTNLIVDGMLKDERRVKGKQLVEQELLLKQQKEMLSQAPVSDEDRRQQEERLKEQETQLHKGRRLAKHLNDMTLFEIGQVGFPCAVIGALYLLLLGRRMLPDRSELIERLDEQRREYLVETLVKPECRLIGKTVEEAGLRHLRGLFLVEIDRQGEAITPITPNDVIRAGDRLIFTGVVTTIVDLEKIPGLVPAADTTYEIHPRRRLLRHLSEAVLSRSSPLIGRTVREANFRQRYNAAVVAVHRNGARLPSKIGDIVLEAGDTLLLQTRTEFASTFRHSRDFYLVAEVEGSQARRYDRAWLAVVLLAALILWLSAAIWIGPEGPLAGLGSTAVAATTIAGLMILSRCLRMAEARSAIDLQLLVTIAAALGLGRALTESGAAKAIAELLVGGVGSHQYLLLVVLYLLSVVFTELITNNAVAAMLFPLGVAMAAEGGFNPRPFVMAIAMAASLSFITPVGYQTNLMVMGPGGYQPRDYLRAGWPLAMLIAVTALLLIPLVWPFAL